MIEIKEWLEPIDVEIIFTEDGKVVYKKHESEDADETLNDD